MLLWLALAMLAGVLSLLAHSYALLPGDLAATRALQERRDLDTVLGPLMLWVSIPGYFPVAEIGVVVAIGVAILARHMESAFLIALTLTGDVTSGALKLVVTRARPSASLITVTDHAGGYSFPSGHVIHYVVFFGALAYLAWPRGHRSSWTRRARQAAVAVCVVLVALVGPSRVYLGAHWISDVLGGYLIGGLCLSAVIVFHRWLTKPRQADAVARTSFPEA